MELNLLEMNAVPAIAPASQDEVKNLTDLELVMVGGGMGDITFG